MVMKLLAQAFSTVRARVLGYLWIAAAFSADRIPSMFIYFSFGPGNIGQIDLYIWSIWFILALNIAIAESLIWPADIYVLITEGFGALWRSMFDLWYFRSGGPPPP